MHPFELSKSNRDLLARRHLLHIRNDGPGQGRGPVPEEPHRRRHIVRVY